MLSPKGRKSPLQIITCGVFELPQEYDTASNAQDPSCVWKRSHCKGAEGFELG